MLRSCLIALSMLACPSAEAQAPMQPSEIFGGLSGSCWKADIGGDPTGGDITDTHCFSVAIGGKLVMDVHKVRNGSGDIVYEGVTLYRLEQTTGAVRYEYYTSGGDLIVGSAKRDGQAIRFPETEHQFGDYAWHLEPESYHVVPLSLPDAKRTFVKVGPVEPGGF